MSSVKDAAKTAKAIKHKTYNKTGFSEGAMFSLIFDNSFIPNVLKCHYIARTPYAPLSKYGYSENAYPFKAAQIYTNATVTEIAALFSAVDNENRTSTFYPSAAITLLPGKSPETHDKMRAHYAEAIDYHNRFFPTVPAVFDLRDNAFLQSGRHFAPEEELAVIRSLYDLQCRYDACGLCPEWYAVLEKNEACFSYRTAQADEYLHLL